MSREVEVLDKERAPGSTEDCNAAVAVGALDPAYLNGLHVLRAAGCRDEAGHRKVHHGCWRRGEGQRSRAQEIGRDASCTNE